ncbi:MAG: hypothetical protein KDE27_15260 [Planctomycetes bacterium]|nr:hypothetical protein [Planctomycetota bacterium]
MPRRFTGPAHLGLGLCLCLGLTATAEQLRAQDGDAGGSREPRFPLAAGEHTIQDLLQMVGQVRGRPLATDPNAVRGTDESTLELQRDLFLSATEWEDVASAILLARGIALVHDGEDLTVTALAAISPDGQPTRERTAAEVLARPYRIEHVVTRFTPNGNPNVMCNAMRPVLAMAIQGAGASLRTDGTDITVAGLSPRVAFALRGLALVDGREVEPAAAVAWPSDAVHWPGGSMKVPELLELLAESTGANVLWREADRPEAAIDLGAAGELSVAACFTRVATTLAELDFVVTVIHAPQRVFEVLPNRSRFAKVALWRAAVVPAAMVRDPELWPQTVLTTTKMPAGGFAALMPVLAQARRSGNLLVGAMPPDYVLLGGPSPTVATFVAKIEALGSEPGERDK